MTIREDLDRRLGLRLQSRSPVLNAALPFMNAGSQPTPTTCFQSAKAKEGYKKRGKRKAARRKQAHEWQLRHGTVPQGREVLDARDKK